MDDHDNNDQEPSCEDQTCSNSNGRVGYGRPPKHTQFPPGTSGNRRGRPAGTKNRKRIVKEVAEEIHVVVENGKRKRRPTLELILRLIRNKTLKGDVRAFRAAHELLAKFAPQASNEKVRFMVAPFIPTQEEWEIEARQVRDKQKRDEAERLAEEAERERREKYKNGPQ